MKRLRTSSHPQQKRCVSILSEENQIKKNGHFPKLFRKKKTDCPNFILKRNYKFCKALLKVKFILALIGIQHVPFETSRSEFTKGLCLHATDAKTAKRKTKI
jgi:hypothetical protein